MFLPAATKLGQGYVFTGVCHSVNRGGGVYPSMHCRWYPSMPCSRSPGGVCSWGVSAPERGCLIPGGGCLLMGAVSALGVSALGRGVCSWGGLLWGDVCLGGCLLPGGVCSGGCGLLIQAHTQGGK